MCESVSVSVCYTPVLGHIIHKTLLHTHIHSHRGTLTHELLIVTSYMSTTFMWVSLANTTNDVALTGNQLSGGAHAKWMHFKMAIQSAVPC